MATDLSPEYLKQIQFPHYPFLHCLIKLRRPIAAIRSMQRLMTPGLRTAPQSVVLSSQKDLIAPTLEEERFHFQTKRWAFIENIFDEEFHQTLITHWPKRKFLVPPKNILKAYDIGLEWERGQSKEIPHLHYHPALKGFFEYLCSPSFGRRITDFSGAERELSCYSFLTTTTYPGSLVPPHKDGYYYYPEARGTLNILFFVDGTGGPHSGGLTLIHDNTFTDVIFEPDQLKNTALIYDVCAPFFHGFRPVARGKFRWAISTLFCPTEYSKKKQENPLAQRKNR